MIFDGIQMAESSKISNMVVESGTQFPTLASIAELFYRSDEDTLYVSNGTDWLPVGSGGSGGGTTYTAGSGITIAPNGTIASTVVVKPSIGQFLVQLSDGSGGFSAVAGDAAQKVLTSNGLGLAPTWQSLPVNAAAAGQNTQLQFNNGGVLGATSKLSYNTSEEKLTVVSTMGTLLNLRSVLSTQSVNIEFGRAEDGEASIGLIGMANDKFVSSLAGDLVIKSTYGAIHIGFSTQPSSKASIVLDRSGNASIGQDGEVLVRSGNADRLRILENGAWSVGNNSNFTGNSGQVLLCSGPSAPPQWQDVPLPALLFKYDIALSVQGLTTDLAVVLSFVANRAFSFANNFAGSYSHAGVTATADAIFTINKNGSSIGTITFAAGQTTAVIAGTGASFSAGDLLTIVAPETADITLANLGITLSGTLVS